MYKIGEFSKITNLTVKTLRYYDEQNILTPSYRNEENSYRFYDEQDFKKAKLITLLRNLEFSISEIKDLLNNYEDPSDLSYFLDEKKRLIEERIRQEKSLLEKIDLYIKPNQMEDDGMNYKVEIKNLKPVTVATIRYKGNYTEVGNYFSKLFRVVKNNAAGCPFNCYYDGEFKEEADIEACVPISKFAEYSDITTKKLPEIKALYTQHIGPYENLGIAYKAIFDYAQKNNIKFPQEKCMLKDLV
jgi:DNA-binding transcriptional MerR regulator